MILGVGNFLVINFSKLIGIYLRRINANLQQEQGLKIEWPSKLFSSKT
jgi:hypothetical protein